MKKYLLIALVAGVLVPRVTSASFFESECLQPAVSGNGVSFETAFSPNEKVSDLVVKSIQSAKKSIKVAAHRFVSKDISIALITAVRSGREVQIVLDKTNKDDGNSSAGFFVHMSAPSHAATSVESQYEDYIIIDGTDLVIGNISSIASAEEEKKNSASVLVVHNAAELARRYEENWKTLWDHSDTIKNENLIRIKDGKVIHGE